MRINDVIQVVPHLISLPPQVEGQNATIPTRDANVEKRAKDEVCSNFIILSAKSSKSHKRHFRTASRPLPLAFRRSVRSPSIKMGRLPCISPCTHTIYQELNHFVDRYPRFRDKKAWSCEWIWFLDIIKSDQ